MKKILLAVLILFSVVSVAQTINNYEFVIVPTKFEFQQTENEFRLSTILKHRLEEFGFQAFYTSDQLNSNYGDRCRYLTVDLVNESSLFTTKLFIVFKDCQNKIVFQSETGKSKLKDNRESYNEALERALQSVKALNYKFNGTKNESLSEDEKSVSVATAVVNDDLLSARPVISGFELADKKGQVVLHLFKTTQADYYIANATMKAGIVFKKNNQWFFEYYLNDKLVSEILSIHF